MISGDARLSGEIRALIGLLKEVHVAQQADVTDRLDKIDVENASISKRVDQILHRLDAENPDGSTADQ